MQPLNTENSIITSLRSWPANLSSRNSSFHRILADKRGFIFERNCESSANFTVYFGLEEAPDTEAKIVVYMLPEPDDTENVDFSSIQSAEVKRDLGVQEDPITVPEAKERVDNWKKHAKEWLEGQQEIFRAISIPANDFQAGWNRITAYFGLVADMEGEYQFDLILYHLNASQSVNGDTYYDTVRLVPPFKPANHYLLTLAES